MNNINNDELIDIVADCADVIWRGLADNSSDVDVLVALDAWYTSVEAALKDRGLQPILGYSCQREDLIDYTTETEVMTFTDGRTIVKNTKSNTYRVINGEVPNVKILQTEEKSISRGRKPHAKGRKKKD